MEKNSSKGIIVLLIIIIIILGTLCVLFATNIISLNINSENEFKINENEQQINNEINNNQNEINNEELSFFEKNKDLNYTSNDKDNINGVVAIIKLGEQVFQKEKNDGYYTYIDNSNNTYEIKQITNITSEYKTTGNDDWANLFKAEIEYLDKDNNKKSFDTAVIIPTDNQKAYIMGPYEDYTGSTSYVKSFTNLYTP